MNSASKVFCFLHVIEGLCSLGLALFHIFRFNDPQEPTQQQPIFLSVFFVYIFISTVGVYLIVKQKLNFVFDAVVVLCGFMVFLLLSITSMHDAESDSHLEILTDAEEAFHPYFKDNRIQSIAALATSFVFLMHFTFVFDCVSNKPTDDGSVASVSHDSLIDNSKPLQLTFFFEDIQKWLKEKCQKILTFRERK